MATTKAEKLTPTRAKLSVTVTQEELAPFLKDAYKTISEQVQIPGFRKGHVPAPIIDQRVGREAVIQEAVNKSLDTFFRAAIDESGEVPMGRPTADVEQWPDAKGDKSDLVLVFEVEVRPEFKLPRYGQYKITVDDAEIGADAVDAELEKLRERFGELKDVDRPAAKDDYVTIDLVASIDGKEVDRATGVSYQVGAGNMLEGMDEAIETLTAGESTTFSSQLLGGEYEGQDAEVEVTVNAVQERELAEANDEFAQLASEFDTLAELKENLAETVKQQAVFKQGEQARDIFIEKLLESAQVPVSEELVAEEVHRHLEQEGRLEDDEHREEVTSDVQKQIALQLILDAIVEAEEVQPTQNELSQYIFQSAQRYGMEPGQFIQLLSQGGQMNAIVGEVTRNKAMAIALAKVNVVDASGNEVDLSEFTRIDTGEEEEAAENTEEKPAKKAGKKDSDKK
ncbi:trigger factor [Canibacter zhoujuaniae]|uniref:trigger factor n=1 Tax=Canibacter zhoujuaniae TaxID=2708343 RepID=UPI00141EC42D|nr:trigger factor [Canibacter zhoujuaniae]